MSTYIMPTSSDVVRLLNDIRDEMVALFGISEAEAVARINRKWRGHDLSSETEIILHEDGYFWALVIYFGGTVPDWHRDADRSSWAPTAPPSPDSPCWT
ncbi:hypothetical protein ABIA39_001406 [Nocardia sp. GAS34]|uniref:hypothetical protein n=1 Tax=unclassified Nocardia TaxID=2637762 RepID=UPI003D195882